jgi:hypothetical protein
MRPQDKKVFTAAASHPAIKCWILVRRTNPAALKYVGLPGFTPKRIDCKAKTADLGDKAGLVVSPKLDGSAFSEGKRGKAFQCWEEFESGVLNVLQSGYNIDIDKSSARYGCVRLGADYVYADYDLYDIIDPLHAQRNLAAVEMLLGQAHRRGPKFYAVQKFVNSQIGAPMVQHGGEAQYADHSEQAIDVFGPSGEHCTILNEFSVRGWYRERFHGRRTLG